MSAKTMLEAHLPEFSGLSSPAWAPLLSGPAEWSAERYVSTETDGHQLDREDYLRTFLMAGDYERQCSTIAKSYCGMFAIHLAIKTGIPHGLRFERYDAVFDRIEALVPLGTVKWLIRRGGEKRHRSLEGMDLADRTWKKLPH